MYVCMYVCIIQLILHWSSKYMSAIQPYAGKALGYNKLFWIFSPTAWYSYTFRKMFDNIFKPQWVVISLLRLRTTVVESQIIMPTTALLSQPAQASELCTHNAYIIYTQLRLEKASSYDKKTSKQFCEPSELPDKPYKLMDLHLGPGNGPSCCWFRGLNDITILISQYIFMNPIHLSYFPNPALYILALRSFYLKKPYQQQQQQQPACCLPFRCKRIDHNNIWYAMAPDNEQRNYIHMYGYGARKATYMII